MDQTVFRRYETKYMLRGDVFPRVKDAILEHMTLDEYGRTTIRSVYFDTASYRLVRSSLEKPDYKEKLRLRSYCRAEEDAPIFVELKKKYDGVVYKRRVAMTEREAVSWMDGDGAKPLQSQIAEEIDYFRKFYGGLRPTAFLSCEREAYISPEDPTLRVTFDENILGRVEALSLGEDVWGTPLIPKDAALLELKTPGAIPLWLTRILTRERLFRTSFSKYGEAYTKMLFGGRVYA